MVKEDTKLNQENGTNQWTGELPVINLPFDFPANIQLDGLERNDAYASRIPDHTIIDAIPGFAREIQCEIPALFLAAFFILLWKYTAQEELVIHLPVKMGKNDNNKQLECEYTEKLPLHRHMDGSDTVRNFLAAVQEQILHKGLDYTQGPGKNYNLQCNVSRKIVLEVFTVQEELNLKIFYSPLLFKSTTIERMLLHYTCVLQAMLQDPSRELALLQYISREETGQILAVFNDTKANYPGQLTIQQVFEEQVRKTPLAAAIIFQDCTLNYRQLNAHANKLAWCLREQGVKPDHVVGIMTERSLEMMIGILGILKAGAAYLPLNPDYPQERLEYMLKDSAVAILLTQEQFKNKTAFRGTVLILDKANSYHTDESNPPPANASTGLAYVIYTSGSTGKPKGVMIEHFAVINRLNWMQKKYPLSEKDVILQKTPFTFDVSVWELFWWFFRGSKVCFLAPGGEKNPDAIIEAIERNGITTLHFVPSMLSVFLDYIEQYGGLERLSGLRRVFASGEALQPAQANKCNQLLYANFNTALVNLYGPTEATVDVSYFDCSPGRDLSTVPIGKPIDNIHLYILDKYNHLQPVGIPGELHIAGDGLARGYINKPELTSEKFVNNPFVPGTRMYKTGDLAKWLPDGNIEFLGRIDHQVKIRGFRIELGEIETELLKIPAIKEVVVVDQEDSEGSKVLVAYLVAKTGLQVQELKNQLAENLPDFMIPAYFTQLPSLPLNFNGKIDRKRLPRPEMGTTGEYIAPVTPVEKSLAEMEQNLFGFKQIGVTDDFFLLGGNSLKAIKLISMIYTKYGSKLQLSEIYKAKTIRALALLIGNPDKTETGFPQLKRAEKKAYYHLPFKPHISDINGEVSRETFFNLGRVDIITGKLDVAQLERAFNAIIARHDVFRSSFHCIDDDYWLKVEDTVSFKLEYEQCSEDDARKKMRSFIKIFDVGVAPLLRASVLQVAKEKYYFFLDMHHNVFDADALDIFDKEIWQLYRGETKQPLPIQYTDYQVWLDTLCSQGIMEKYKAYWMQKLQGFQLVRLPPDNTDANVNTNECGKERFIIDTPGYRAIDQLCREWKITRPGFIISSCMLLLAKETRQQDITVGLYVSNRFDTRLNGIIGCFLEHVILRSQFAYNENTDSFYGRVNTTLAEAVDYCYYPHKLLNAEIDKLNTAGYKDFISIMINYIEEDDNIFFMSKDLHREQSLILKTNYTPYDINFKIIDNRKELILQFKYKSSLFSQARISNLIADFKKLINEVLVYKYCTIEDLFRRINV